MLAMLNDIQLVLKRNQEILREVPNFQDKVSFFSTKQGRGGKGVVIHRHITDYVRNSLFYIIKINETDWVEVYTNNDLYPSDVILKQA